eukprot:4024599-Ditylum_brightwellii.AAC.1
MYKKYGFEDNIDLTALHLPPNSCCYNIYTAEEKLNQCCTGLDYHYDLLQDLDWKSSLSIL